MSGPERSIRRICVFCGSSAGGREEYAQSARALAEALVQRRLGLVYGGGRVGLMGIIASRVLELGGHVIGVIPESLRRLEVAHERLPDLRVVDGMHTRKALMSDLSDAFVALPGGLGTLEELFEVVTWAQLGIHAKPIGVLNVHGYYDPLLALLDHAVTEGFLRSAHRDLVRVADDAGSLVEDLLTVSPPVQTPQIRPDER